MAEMSDSSLSSSSSPPMRCCLCDVSFTAASVGLNKLQCGDFVCSACVDLAQSVCSLRSLLSSSAVPLPQSAPPSSRCRVPCQLTCPSCGIGVTLPTEYSPLPSDVPSAAADVEAAPPVGISCENGCGSKATVDCDRCLASLCEGCFVSLHSKSAVLQKHSRLPLGTVSSSSLGSGGDARERKPPARLCLKHGKDVELLCNDDGSFGCVLCAVSGRHDGHKLVAVTAENASKWRTEAKGISAELQKRADAASAACSVIRQSLQDLNAGHDAFERGATAAVAKIHRAAEERLQQLVKTSQEVRSEKETRLREQLDCITRVERGLKRLGGVIANGGRADSLPIDAASSKHAAICAGGSTELDVAAMVPSVPTPELPIPDPADVIAAIAMLGKTQETTLRPVKPAAPKVGLASPNSALVQWEGIDGTCELWMTSNGGELRKAFSGTKTSHLATGLRADTQYSFFLRQVGTDVDGGEEGLGGNDGGMGGPFSELATLKTPRDGAASGQVQTELVASTDKTITLKWNAPPQPQGTPAATGWQYRLWLAAPDEEYKSVWSGSDTQCTLEDLQPATWYRTVVRKQDPSDSSDSTVLVVTAGSECEYRTKRAFVFDHAYDGNGVIHWLGCHRGECQEWENPSISGMVVVDSSSAGSGNIHDVVGNEVGAFQTLNAARQWVSVDLGPDLSLEVTHYTMSHWRGGPGNSLRNWELQGSNDGDDWTVLSRHSSDVTLTARNSTGNWKVQSRGKSFRMFRVLMTGPNSLNNDLLVVSGIDLYGYLQDEL